MTTDASSEPIRAGAIAQAAPVGDHRRSWRRRLAYAVLIGYAVLMFIPFAWSVITSFKTLPDSVRLTVVPEPFTTAGWDFALTKLNPPLPVLFFNSAIIATAVTFTNLVLGSIAGYAFARLRFPGREVLFLIVLATLMIPDQLRLVPVYVMLNGVGLTRGVGQYVGVIAVLAISATSIFLLRQYFLSIPRELEEAARIDGAGFFTTFWRVMLPWRARRSRPWRSSSSRAPGTASSGPSSCSRIRTTTPCRSASSRSSPRAGSARTGRRSWRPS